MTDIQKRLFDLQDEKYRDFSMKLTPSADPDTFIRVRLPQLRALAQELKGTDEAEEFINTLPHEYFDEYHLHAFLLSYIKDFDEGVAQLERLLPYIDNWSTCDSIRVKAFEKEPERLLPYIKKWLDSGHTYTIRCGIMCLMNLFLNDRYDPKYPDMVAAVKSEEYYVRMMVAWYFATALAKQYDSAVGYIENKGRVKWTRYDAITTRTQSYWISHARNGYVIRL